MGLFSKKTPANDNQPKKNWADVIKNTGIGGDIVYRHPLEDFNTNSTVIVMPGEEAVFVNQGNVEQVFTSGTYKLSTQNYPFISRLRNRFTGGVSVFSCVVYFVRTASSVEVRWGTDGAIQVRDKILGIQTNLKARGSYRMKIGNAGVFLHKLLGNGINSMSPSELEKYFGQEFLGLIKNQIATYVSNGTGEILGIASHQDEIAKSIEPEMAQSFADYGIELLKFTISAIDLDDNELRRKYDEIGMDAIAKVRNAQADKSVMDILGQNWQAQQQVDIYKEMVAQQGQSSDAARMGMGMAAAGAFFNMGQQFSQQHIQPSAPPPPMPQYYAFFNNQQVGPLTITQLGQYVASGNVNANTLVWCEGLSGWTPASAVPQLASLFGGNTPPPLPSV